MTVLHNPDRVLALIQDEANGLVEESRFVRGLRPGQWVRQGDVYFVMTEATLGSVISTPIMVDELPEAGGRHQVVGSEVCWYPRDDAGPLDGPVLEAEARFEVVHPEHANLSLPSGVYVIQYQRDYEADRIRRVKD